MSSGTPDRIGRKSATDPFRMIPSSAVGFGSVALRTLMLSIAVTRPRNCAMSCVDHQPGLIDQGNGVDDLSATGWPEPGRNH